MILNFLKQMMTGLGAIVAVLAVLAGGFFTYACWYTDIRPIFFGHVITDPDDPKFDPTQFRFEYYWQGKERELPAALLKMFPPGTDMAYVDKVLLTETKYSYLTIRKEEDQRSPDGSVTYGYVIDYNVKWDLAGGERVRFTFDKNNKSIWLYFGGLLYSDSHRPPIKPPISDEDGLRPIRKKYLGVEDGYLK